MSKSEVQSGKLKVIQLATRHNNNNTFTHAPFTPSEHILIHLLAQTNKQNKKYCSF